MELKNRAKRAMVLQKLQREMRRRTEGRTAMPVKKPVTYNDNSLKGIDLNRKRNIAKKKKGGF